MKFLDPACGSGNFLTETYISLRKLENKILMELSKGQIVMGDFMNPIQVSIGQFYGIEINDFAVTVAKTALWIAESQMMKETEDIVHMQLDFLPLKTNAYIAEGNALRMDWNDVVPKTELNYIMGNPPFVGARLMNDAQKNDVLTIFDGYKNAGNLDYVCCWYKKAADLQTGTNLRAALVSTNSVSQGETVANLWKPLFENGVHIDFAYRTFRWDSEAKIKAHVHCVIIGFSKGINTKKEEKEAFVKKEPASEKWFKLWYGSDEFINRRPRYCLWLGECPPNELRHMPECLKRVEEVRKFRLASKSAGTVKLAERPTRFHVENMPTGNYILIPEVSSESASAK